MDAARVSSLLSLRPSSIQSRKFISRASFPSATTVTLAFVTPRPCAVRTGGSFSGGGAIPCSRRLSVAATGGSETGAGEVIHSSHQSAAPFVRSVLSKMENVYLSRNPSAKAILDLVHSNDGAHVCYDHFAFRTFGVDGYGIDSMARFFLDFGYSPRDELRFPSKKLKAVWFSPPDSLHHSNGSGTDGPLPRIFISELLVDEMSSHAQEIIRRYVKLSGTGNKYATLASAMGSLTWGRPLYSDYKQLSSESEYAAWTLVNGYALNHVTISAHRLKSHIRDIHKLNKFIEDNGFKLNSEGGVLKESPDGLLLQSSTVADSTTFQFAEGTKDDVPCSYIEFAERLVLPPYRNLAAEEIKEYHRRDGFEVGNADKIFESTSKVQLSKKIV